MTVVVRVEHDDIGAIFRLADTRRMIHAALGGELEAVPTVRDDVFGLAVPERIEGVDSKLLRPRDTWTDPAAYDAQLQQLAAMFRENFEQFREAASEEVLAAVP